MVNVSGERALFLEFPWLFSQAESLIRSQVKRRKRLSFWVTAREAFWIALEALRAHKLRSFLTLLGVVIATTTLIVVMSVINGMNLYIADHIANLGANVFVLDQYNWGNTSDEEWLKEQRRNKPIRMEDYEFLKRTWAAIRISAPRPGAGRNNAPEIRYGTHTLYEVQVTGQTPSMIDMEQEQVGVRPLLYGRGVRAQRLVCFIGQDLVDEFFPAVDPLDKVIAIGGQPFRVVGVAKRIGKTLGQSQDDFVQMPLTTFDKLFASGPSMNVSDSGAERRSDDGARGRDSGPDARPASCALQGDGRFRHQRFRHHHGHVAATDRLDFRRHDRRSWPSSWWSAAS